MDEKLLRKIAVAIWKGTNGIERLLDEPARYGSSLAEQQFRCWQQARSVYDALFH